MKVSIFTPVHKIDIVTLYELFLSIDKQLYVEDFEWIILLNGEANTQYNYETLLTEHFHSASWVKIYRTDTTGNIGALKAECCELAQGEILIEVDYDDTLTANAIHKIEEVFDNNPNTQFAYSNCWEFLPNGATNTPYGTQYGWKTKDYIFGRTQMVSFPALPQYLRRIEWSPNHVRAFRKSAYQAVGGYDRSIAVGDDHDLICRFYRHFGQNGFAHIDDVLYHYRVHPNNTSNGQNRNAEVQIQVDINYQRHAEAMFLKWAINQGLIALDLGGRFNCPEGYASVDLLDAHHIADLTVTWPFEDDSVGVLRAYHILEHLPDTIHFFNEAFRVLAPGGLLLIEVPSTNGKGAFSDPTHISFFNDLSFEYFTNENYARFIRPQFKGKFQKSRIVEYNWQDPNIPIVSAQMICLKGWYEENWCGIKQM